MKRNFLITLATAIAIAFTSCGIGKPIVSDKAENNKTYTVDYLFEQDGCKVYRFYDQGQYVYFTNCTGNVCKAETDSTKTRTQTIINRR